MNFSYPHTLYLYFKHFLFDIFKKNMKQEFVFQCTIFLSGTSPCYWWGAYSWILVFPTHVSSHDLKSVFRFWQLWVIFGMHLNNVISKFRSVSHGRPWPIVNWIFYILDSCMWPINRKVGNKSLFVTNMGLCIGTYTSPPPHVHARVGPLP